MRKLFNKVAAWVFVPMAACTGVVSMGQGCSDTLQEKPFPKDGSAFFQQWIKNSTKRGVENVFFMFDGAVEGAQDVDWEEKRKKALEVGEEVGIELLKGADDALRKLDPPADTTVHYQDYN